MIINLASITGLPIVYNSKEQSFTFDESLVNLTPKITYSLRRTRRQFINPFTFGIKKIYKTYQVLGTQLDLKKIKFKLELIELLPGIVGIEFLKTGVNYLHRFPQIIEIGYGRVMVVIQKPLDRIKLGAKNVVIVKASAGDRLVIPPYHGYYLVNYGRRPVLALTAINQKADKPRKIHNKKGGAFYIINRNGKMEIVRNPRYKRVETYSSANIQKLLKYVGLTPKTPILRQFIRKYEQQEWFYKPSRFDWASYFS